MNNWKTIFKSWTGVPVLILVVLVLIWGIPYLKSTYNVWQINNEYKKLAEPYLNDTYGGATPEETYDLFIEALKNDDIELASKYFVVYKQDNWLKILQEYKKEGIILVFAEELENTKKIWKKSDESTETMVSFTYQVLIEEAGTTIFEGQELNIPAGNFTNESVYIKYPNGVWKIEGL